MVNKFSHSGKSKAYPKPENNKPKLFNSPTWILDGSAPEQNIISRGSVLLQKYEKSEILEYYLDFIHMVSSNPRIVIVSGVSNNEFIKHGRSAEYGIIENQLYRLTNSAENLRLGILGSPISKDTFFIEKPIIPKIEIFKRIAENKRSKIVCIEETNSKKIGLADSNEIKFVFGTNIKLSGLYYFNEQDLIRLRKKIIGPSFAKNKFAFEMFTNIKFKIVMEENANINEL